MNLALNMNLVHFLNDVAFSKTTCSLHKHSFDIASRSSQDSNGIMKWPKQPSRKAMKERKFKSNEILEDLLTPKSETTFDDVVGIMSHSSPFKKPKRPQIEKKEDLGHVNSIRVANYWLAPRSSRSSPIRLPRDVIAEAGHSNGNFVRRSLFIPPPRGLRASLATTNEAEESGPNGLESSCKCKTCLEPHSSGKRASRATGRTRALCLEGLDVELRLSDLCREMTELSSNWRDVRLSLVPIVRKFIK
ncbi:hypothetical protein Dimus_030870 [Dionaea muscipula]